MSAKLDLIPKQVPKNIPNPPGYTSSPSIKDASTSKQPQTADTALQTRRSNDLKSKRAWELALSSAQPPAKSLPMQAIMLYFSGSGVQIFSLGMIFMLLTGPITSVLGIFKAFESLRPTLTVGKSDTRGGKEGSYASLALPMLTYVGCQALVLALGLYKCSSMGVLPTSSSHWLQFETRADPPEWSAARTFSLG